MSSTQVLVRHLRQPEPVMLDPSLLTDQPSETALDALLRALEEAPEKVFDMPLKAMVNLQSYHPTKLYVSPGLHGLYKAAGLQKPVIANEPYVEAEYEYDPVKFQAQNAEVLKRKDLEDKLPLNFPAKTTGDLCWSGATGPVPREEDYVFHLDEEDLAEIKGALAHYKSMSDNDVLNNPPGRRPLRS
jgi:hypothetical protein